jgi:pilus assembly protein Flp/PilA
MNTYIRPLQFFIADESGATLVEYGLLVSLIAAACVVALTTLGSDLKAIFTKIGTDL